MIESKGINGRLSKEKVWNESLSGVYFKMLWLECSRNLGCNSLLEGAAVQVKEPQNRSFENVEWKIFTTDEENDVYRTKGRLRTPVLFIVQRKVVDDRNLHVSQNMWCRSHSLLPLQRT